MKSACIIDPCDVWAEGVAAILTSAGFAVEISSPWRGGGAIEIASDKVTLIAKPLLPQELMRPLPRGIDAQSQPMVVAVLHARDEMTLHEFVPSGLAAVLLSTASREAVLDCMRSVLNHQRWIDPHFAPQFTLDRAPRVDWSCLSHREMEVAELAAQGMSNKHIAKALHLSDGTVKIHVHHILGKLGVERRAALVGQGPAQGRDHELG